MRPPSSSREAAAASFSKFEPLPEANTARRAGTAGEHTAIYRARQPRATAREAARNRIWSGPDEFREWSLPGSDHARHHFDRAALAAPAAPALALTASQRLARAPIHPGRTAVAEFIPERAVEIGPVRARTRRREPRERAWRRMPIRVPHAAREDRARG
jgi:hypothetical protein